MHQIQIDDQLFHEAQRRASAAGFESVDEYVADVLQYDLREDAAVIDHLFTPERLAHIDRAAAQIEAGQGMSCDQADAELARRRAEWLHQNRS